MKYKCIKTFRLPMRKRTVYKNSIWEHEHDYENKSGARLYQEDGDDDGGYIDIMQSCLETCFQRID